jgi:ubiquinone biosynthesis protein
VISSLSNLARLARAGYVLAREGVFVIADPLPMTPPARAALRLARLIERRDVKEGDRLSRALARLGPAYVKLGQFLATRPDVVGLVLARDLESLQDKLPPFPQKQAEAQVEEAFERPLNEVFASFGPPVAAAQAGGGGKYPARGPCIRDRHAFRSCRSRAPA